MAINEFKQFVDQALIDAANVVPASGPNNEPKTDVHNINRAHFFRTPFTMSCVSWNRLGKQILFRCNPNKVDYEWPIRGATQNVKSGKVFYWWKNQNKGSHFDLPSITFSFQSGNIVVLSEDSDPRKSPTLYMPKGLDNFHQFMAIIDEVKMLSDGTPNFITINHHSAIFPNLMLTGFFDPSTAITVSESADDPSMFSWSAKFFVHDSNPRFNSAQFAKAFETVFVKGNYDGTKK